MKDLDSLHFIFFGVDDVQETIETAIDDIAYDRATRLMYVVGAANHDDAPRIQ